jgi:flagellar M-ring protein FliF
MATATLNNPAEAGTMQAPAAGQNMPATTAQPGTDGQLVPASGLPSVSTSTELLNGVRNVLMQPAVRKALPAFVVLIALIVFGIAYSWIQATPHRPIMPGMSEMDQQAAFDALRNNNFNPRIDQQNGQLTVPSDKFHQARIFLASQGIPKAGPIGLDGLRDQSSMTTSQFMEQVKVNAAMEQELARSVMQIATIQSARVHLATPRQSVFVRDRVPPKASVVVSPFPGRMVAPSQVQAIVHLVSSSVPYLTPDNVTVIDHIGNLLTESASELKLGLTAAQAQHKTQLEDMYRQRIMQILAPVVGEMNVRTQVNLVLDFTQVETTTEDYDTGDRGPRTRSESLAEDRAARVNAEGVPGALTNTPPPNAVANPNTAANPNTGVTEGSETLSSRTTRNFEIDRTVRHVRNAMGGVQRVSVAVVINERPMLPPEAGAEGEEAQPRPQPYTPEDMQRLNDLVRGVVGFDAQRGDLVTVVPARFEPPEALIEVPWYLQNEVHQAGRFVLVGLMFMVFLLIVIRPIMRAMYDTRKAADAAEEAKKALADGELSEEDMRMIQIGEGETLEEIKAKLKPKKSAISMDMLDTANTYDDKVALIRMLVAEDSARVANVLKGMIRVV